MPIPSPDFGGIKTGLFHERVLADSGTVLPNVAPPIIDKLQKLGVYPPALLYVPGGLNEAVAYSQLPTSSDGDFTVSRNTTTAGETGFATCVNQDGYYQNYLPDYPTIDYSNNGVPALLTQPQRVQLVTRPLSFGHSDWTKSGATIEGDASTAGVDMNVSSCVNVNYTTFGGASATGFTATSDGAATHRAGTADELILVTNPEMPAITDALKTIKLAEQMKRKVKGIIVTRVRKNKFEMQPDSVKEMLETPILGMVPEDLCIQKSINLKDAVVHTHPKSKSARAYKEIAAKILNIDYDSDKDKENIFKRIANAFGWR